MNTTNVLIRKRITVLLLLVSLLLIALMSRLAWLQFVRGKDLQEMAKDNRMREVPVEAKRGAILDRNGRELAVSVSSDAVYAIPAEIPKEKREEVAKKVSDLLELPYDKVLARISKRSSFEWLKMWKVDPAKSQKLRELDLPGIGLTERSERYYPKGNLGAHILGFVGVDNKGLAGIEKNLDRNLSGIPGRVVVEYDAKGREIPQALHKYIPPEEGNSLLLTIDETIQYITERELDKVMAERSPKAVTAVVMNPKTGEILALANRPDFNPNKYSESSEESRRNFAINNNYEPGSTFKIITAAAAMDEGTLRVGDQFNCNGYTVVSGRRIKCWNYPKAHGHQDFTTVAANSCNAGFIAVGTELGSEKFYKYIRAFGFGKKTGVEIPGEATGIVIPEKSSKVINIATMSIGQSIAVTPMQLVSAVSAVANGGKLIKPHMVKEIRSNDGKVVKTYEPEMIRQVVSESTAKELADVLENVVSKGTGKNAYVEGYRVAGKTGTAQKVGANGGYERGRYVASFMGFAPANDPELVVLVALDEPQGYPYYGGTVAAPVVGAIIKDSLRYLGIPPQYDVELKEEKDKMAETKVVVPNLLNIPLSDAEKLLKMAGLTPELKGEGAFVYQQVPRPGVTVKIGSKVILNVSDPPKRSGSEITVPNFTGKSLREVANILGALNLRLEVVGSGLAIEQNVAPGTKVKPGTKIKVTFDKYQEPMPENQETITDSIQDSINDEKGP